jgi:hypothetical protein
MENEMIQFIKENVDMEEVNFTYKKMCENKTPLYHQNYALFVTIDALIVDFCCDNNIDEYYDVEDIFNEIID